MHPSNYCDNCLVTKLRYTIKCILNEFFSSFKKKKIWYVRKIILLIFTIFISVIDYYLLAKYVK